MHIRKHFWVRNIVYLPFIILKCKGSEFKIFQKIFWSGKYFILNNNVNSLDSDLLHQFTRFIF